MTELPSLQVKLTLPRLVSSKRKVQAQVATDIAALAETLGLEVTPTVEVRTADSTRHRIAIHIDGIRLRYDQRAELHLAQVTEERGGGETDFIARLVHTAVAANPTVLVGDQQALIWCERAGIAASDVAVSALRAAIGQGRSVKDGSKIAALLEEAAHLDPCHPGEALNGLLDGLPVMVQLAPDYLRSLPAVPPGEMTAASVQENLSDSLGVLLPPVQIEPDSSLRGTEIRVQINNLPVASFRGLPPQEYAVMRPQEEITAEEKASSRQIIFPGGQRGHTVSASDQTELASRGVSTWNPTEVILLAVNEVAIRYAPRLLTRAHIIRQLNLMRDQFPVLVADALAVGCAGELTQLAAGLLAELCPIRDLEAILQTYACWRISPGDPPEDLKAAVRRALGVRLTTAELPRGTVTVYLIHPDIEAAVSRVIERRGLDEQEKLADELLLAIETQLDKLPPDTRTPSLLTTADSRPIIQGWITAEQPRMRVLAFDEIPCDVLVQPIERISPSPIR